MSTNMEDDRDGVEPSRGRPYDVGRLDLPLALDKLRRFAATRNRTVDPVPRVITLTDDEALALLMELERNRPD